MSTLSYLLTSVVTPPTHTDLTTATTVMADWNIPFTSAAFVTRTVSRCSRAAEDYCNRTFGIAQYQVIARLEKGYRDGHLTLGAASPIMLPLWPIASFVSVTETDENGTVTTLVENTDYESDYTTGKLYRLDSYGRQRDWWPRLKVTINCWSGYILPGDTASYPGASPLPAHLEDAIGRMAATRYFESRRDPYVRSETVEGVGSIDYTTQGTRPTDAGNLSADVSDILDNFRAPIVA